MQRCKECGIPIQDGEFCSDNCRETWVKRENPEQFNDTEEDKEDVEEVFLETHFSITPVNIAEKPEKEDESKESALFDAVANSNSNSVKAFIDNGADIEVKNDYGYTALHEAARVGDVRSVAFLLGAGADVNAVNNKGWTPLHRASNYGNLDVVKLLIEKNANMNQQEADGLVPLAIACEREHFEIAKYLAIKGSDPNCIDKKGRPVLVLALKKDQMKLARLLIENGADPNAKDGNDSALLIVLKNGDLDFVKFLIEKGANPNIGDGNGVTALIYALKYEYVDIAKLFIENGANVGCKDGKGQTPLHYAAKMNKEDLVKLLLGKGAKPVIWNKYGQMPLHLSKSKNVRRLLNKKMFPAKFLYSLRVFFLVFLLTSVTIPTIISYAFSVIVFFIALVITDWPRKTSMRLYLLEVVAVFLLVTTAFGIYPEDFSYPYVFLLLPVAVFVVLNFIIRPVFLFFSSLNDDGKRPVFMDFVRDFFVTRISFSPITLLRTLNTIVIVVLLFISVVYNYEHLKKNDQYLLSHVLRSIPRIKIFNFSSADKRVMNPGNIRKSSSKYKSPEPGENKAFDRAINMYLKKDFKGAVTNLSYAAQDPTVEGRASELKLEIKRFSILWKRANSPEKYKKRRGNPINRMIQYDKNISGGKLESEILMLKHTAGEINP